MTTRLADTLMSNTNRAYGTGATAPVLNLKHGGSFGHFADFGEYINATPYVSRNLICRVIAVPNLYRDLPDGEYWTAAAKALFELHPKAISGFSAQLNPTYEETEYGGSGEMMEVISNVTRERITPSFSYVDKEGRPIAKFINANITMFGMDPDTKAPNIVTFSKFRNKGNSQSKLDLLPDNVGFTLCFFEPDPTFTRIEKAYLCTNVRFKTAPPEESQRDKTQGGQLSEFDIEMTALTQHGVGPQRLAQKLMDEMNLSGSNPNFHPAFVDKVTADVGASYADKGYFDNLQAMASKTLQQS